jgi:hypothetical protein
MRTSDVDGGEIAQHGLCGLYLGGKFRLAFCSGNTANQSLADAHMELLSNGEIRIVQLGGRSLFYEKEGGLQTMLAAMYGYFKRLKPPFQ